MGKQVTKKRNRQEELGLYCAAVLRFLLAKKIDPYEAETLIRVYRFKFEESWMDVITAEMAGRMIMRANDPNSKHGLGYLRDDTKVTKEQGKLL